MSRKNVTCYFCRQSGHYSDKCPNKIQQKTENLYGRENPIILPPSSCSSYKLVLKLDGKWGERSAYIHPESSFFLLKKSFTDYLLKKGYIVPADIDTRNDIPHIELSHRGDEKEFETEYAKLDGKEFMMTIRNFNIRDNYVDISVDGTKHVTLFYKQGLFEKISTNTILTEILEPFKIENNPENSRNMLCSICMENNLECIFRPCNHISTCNNCASRLSVCPTCRSIIEKTERIFIQGTE